MQKNTEVGGLTLNLPDSSKCPSDKKCDPKTFDCKKTKCFRNADCSNNSKKACITNTDISKNKCVDVQCVKNEDCGFNKLCIIKDEKDPTKNFCTKDQFNFWSSWFGDKFELPIGDFLCHSTEKLQTRYSNRLIEKCQFVDINGNSIPNIPDLIPYEQGVDQEVINCISKGDCGRESSMMDVCIRKGGECGGINKNSIYRSFYSFKGYRDIPYTEIANVYNSRRADDTPSWVIKTYIKCWSTWGEVGTFTAIFNLLC